MDGDDVLQIALMTLWECCQTFDESRGYKFGTYAGQYMRFKILKELRDTEPIRTPRYFKDIRSRILEYGFSLPLSDEEIAILLMDPEITPKKLHNYLSFNIASLDYDVSDEANKTLTLENVIADPYKEETSDGELDEMIELIASNMKEQYREMIVEWMSSAVYDEKPLTQNELSRKYGLSQAQVSRVLKTCINLVQYHKQDILDIVGAGGGDV